jgi:hypothetical protein
MRLLGGVLENVTVFALAWVLHAAFRSRARVPLVSMSVSLRLYALACWWRWCHHYREGLRD